MNRVQLKYFGADLSETEKNDALKQIKELLDELKDAKEYGSILNISAYNWQLLKRFVSNESAEGQMTFDTIGIDETKQKLEILIKIGQVMAQKYDAVVTNPPYMGASSMGFKLTQFVKDNYPDTKSDMFACFIEKGLSMAKKMGCISMITMESWMFLSSFEKMRQNIVSRKNIVNMVHMPYLGKGGTSLGINFGTAAVVIKNYKVANYSAQYDYICYYETDNDGVPFEFPTKNERYKSATIDNFAKVPGYPIAYWVSDKFIDTFNNPLLGAVATPKQGVATANNNYYLRQWFECTYSDINFVCKSHSEAESSPAKWYPYNKGGEFRKWYGNNDYVVNWYKGGFELMHDKKAVIRNPDYFFKHCISWSLISSQATAFRFKPDGFIFDVAGMSCFASDNLYYLCGFCNTKLAYNYLKILAPTINFQVGDIAKLPIIIDNQYKEKVETIVKSNIILSKDDWDSFEISWDFKKHPLLQYASFTPQEIAADKARYISDMGWIRDAYELWNDKCESRFSQLKANEEELNRIFIDIYGLQDELTPDVEDKDVTVRKADLQREIKSLLSYAVGCMFGRYSLDCEGIAYAGGEWDDSKYETFIPDKDNCIPITDDEYSEDDIVGRLCEWLKKVYGAETLEENLDFIAKALGNKGKTSRETIREYFVNDFMADHMRIYQKRPIYWVFDSGKANGFKALVYMHRYNSDTVAKVRVDYLHNIQKSIEQAKLSAEYLRDNGSGAEKAKATKLITKYTKQLAEIHLYDEAMAHIASQRIEIDLDDGVKVNYEKFQGVEVAQEGKKAIKVDLLAKI